MKRLLLLTTLLVALSAINVNALTIMDQSFGYSETLDASSMRQRITATYTGDISYDGPNRRLVLNNFVADVSDLNYFLYLDDVFPEGFTIEFHGNNEITCTDKYRNPLMCWSNLRFMGDMDALFIMNGGGRVNGLIWMLGNASLILDGGSYSIAPSTNFGAVPIMFSGDYKPSQRPTADAATVTLANIPQKSFVLRECNAWLHGGSYLAFTGCLGYFGMHNCEVTQDLYYALDNGDFYRRFLISDTDGRPYYREIGGIDDDQVGDLIAEMAFERMIPIDEAHFPDANFRVQVGQYDTHRFVHFNGDGYLLPEEFNAVTTMSLAGKNITNLQGIRYFTELQQLECYNNKLTSLNVSGLTNLQRLLCYNNRLEELHVAGDESLVDLQIYKNRIGESKMQELVHELPHPVSATTFNVFDNNQFTELNVITPSQVIQAKNKGWYPKYNSGTWSNPQWSDYDGTEPYYPIVIADTQVTQSNASNITATGITGTVKYIPGSNTLLLENATITGDDCIRVGASLSGLKIQVIGEVNLNATRHARPAVCLYNSDDAIIEGISSSGEYAKLNINVPGGNYTTPAIYFISNIGGDEHRAYIKDIDIHMTGNAYVGSENWDERLTIVNSNIISEAPNGEFYVIDDVQLDGCYVALPEGGYFDRGQLCNAQGQTYYGPYQILRTQAEAVPGDVNGDGNVTSTDVTALYSYLLNNDSSAIVNGDQNGDGSITSADVTMVYNILLGN